MAGKTTLPYDPTGRTVAVDTLRVEVVEGPDTGTSRAAESETLTVGSAQGNDLVLADETVSRYHAELIRRPDGIRIRDHGSTNGTLVGAVRVLDAVVPPGTVVRVGRTALKVGEGEKVELELHAQTQLGALRGASPGMRRLMALIQKAARTDAPVLVVGESGTGKELIAQALHDLGPRSGAPFVTVDCGALAPNLVASELFGHERGAFTGADRQHVGAFEQAHGGTLFLDEIGEVPPELQPNLLGALERRRFRRVGGRKDIEVDCRVVAATNRDLRAEVNDGRFRLDLYYRLAVVTLQVPPLRERAGDVLLLVDHFLSELGYEGSREEAFPDGILDALLGHHWPGNVRELRNLVEATVAMGEAPLPDDFGVGGSAPPPAAGGASLAVSRFFPLAYKDARTALMREFEVLYAQHWLEATDGNVARAAREARMDRSHLFHLIRRHRLRE